MGTGKKNIVHFNNAVGKNDQCPYADLTDLSVVMATASTTNKKEQSAFAERILLQLSVDKVIQLPPSEDAIAV